MACVKRFMYFFRRDSSFSSNRNLIARTQTNAPHVGRSNLFSLTTLLHTHGMPRMAFLDDIALQARPSPLQAWPEVEEEHEHDRETGQLGAGHQHQDTGTPGSATVQPRIDPVVISPLTALGMYGRALSGSAMSTHDHQGGVVTAAACTGRLSLGLHDARGNGHDKRKQSRVWHALKSLAIATALVSAVVVVVNQGEVCVV